MIDVGALVLLAAGLLTVPAPASGRLGRIADGSVASVATRASGQEASHSVPKWTGCTKPRNGGLRRLPWPRGRRRTEEGSDADVAFVGDLFAACLQAGLPVPLAVRAVATTVGEPLGPVLRGVADALALGASAEVAWQQARRRAATADLARAACRTATSGSALATESAQLARRLRQASSDRVEERAQRAGVLIAGPLGLCFLPAFVCLGVVPVIAGLAAGLAVPT